MALYQDWARLRIEAMSDRPPAYCRTAYTSRRTMHVAFCNGAIRVEGEEGAPAAADPAETAEALVRAVRAYRDTVPGPHLLVWRKEPEFTSDPDDGRWRLYARLCFETDTQRAEEEAGLGG